MKRFIAILLGLLTLLTVCACGNRESDNGKVKITVDDFTDGSVGLDIWVKERQDLFDEQYPDIEVEHVARIVGDASKNVQSVINNLSTQSGAATVIQMNANNYVRTVYVSGLTADWTPYLSEEMKQSFDETVLEGFKKGDEITGLPYQQEFPLLAFNRKHLRAQNISDEEIDTIKTWDDFLPIAKKLSGTYTVAGSTVNVSGYAGQINDYYTMGIWNIANNYQTVTQNQDETIEVNLDNQSSVETYQFLQTLKSEGAMTLNTNTSFTDYFNAIFQNRVASFIYYPSWSAVWFEPQGIRASDIKVINMPLGPSAVQARENGEEIATNANFTQGYVLNARASEEQKQAAATYMEFMLSHEAWESRIQFAKDENIPMLVVPPYKYTDQELNDNLFTNIPEDWKSSLINSIKNPYIYMADSDAFINYVAPHIPGIVNGSDSYGNYDSAQSIAERLQALENTIYSEWLNAYNQQVKG